MTDAQMTVKPPRWLCSVFAIQQLRQFAFSALTLFVGRQEEHPVCKIWVVGCWRGHLSGVRCRLAYGPADATATHCLLLQWNPDWFYLSGPSSPGYSPGKEPLNGCCFVDNLSTIYQPTDWTDRLVIRLIVYQLRTVPWSMARGRSEWTDPGHGPQKNSTKRQHNQTRRNNINTQQSSSV